MDVTDTTITVPDSTQRLFEAVEKGNFEGVSTALEAGADVNATREWRITPLHVAVAGNHTDVAHMLLAQGAQINAATEYGSTPLHWAAELGCADAVLLLIQIGADVHAMNESHETPLQRAAARGHNNIMDILESAGIERVGEAAQPNMVRS